LIFTGALDEGACGDASKYFERADNNSDWLTAKVDKHTKQLPKVLWEAVLSSTVSAEILF